MKTKTLRLAMAALAIAVTTPAAFARPDFPVKRLTAGPRTTTVERMPEHCSMSCCVTKWKSNPALGGRGASSSFKKVKACTRDCHVSPKERRMVCRMGSRA